MLDILSFSLLARGEREKKLGLLCSVLLRLRDFLTLGVLGTLVPGVVLSVDLSVINCCKVSLSGFFDDKFS